MAKTIYTERDVEDFAKRGVKELAVDEQIYITDLAREKMQALGIKTRQVQPGSAASYVSGSIGATGTGQPLALTAKLGDSERLEIVERVKSGVIARLGPGVDRAVLDTIVKRVVSQL